MSVRALFIGGPKDGVRLVIDELRVTMKFAELNPIVGMGNPGDQLVHNDFVYVCAGSDGRTAVYVPEAFGSTSAMEALFQLYPQVEASDASPRSE